ncbi:MAG: hypothetical protein RLZZ232_3290 [Planctomycetota bacterium]|jgi:hypothetical protein
MGGDEGLGESGRMRASLPVERDSHRARVRGPCTDELGQLFPVCQRTPVKIHGNLLAAVGRAGFCGFCGLLRKVGEYGGL